MAKCSTPATATIPARARAKEDGGPSLRRAQTHHFKKHYTQDDVYMYYEYTSLAKIHIYIHMHMRMSMFVYIYIHTYIYI